jgi:hypothetical protein
LGNRAGPVDQAQAFELRKEANKSKTSRNTRFYFKFVARLLVAISCAGMLSILSPPVEAWASVRSDEFVSILDSKKKRAKPFLTRRLNPVYVKVISKGCIGDLWFLL